MNARSLIDTYEIELDRLYDQAELLAFQKRLADFVTSDPSAPHVVSFRDGVLTYQSESYIPPLIDPRKKNLLLVLGNPAPESVMMGAMFAYENHGRRYHRFWRVLDAAGVLRFKQHPDSLDPHMKMKCLFTNDYTSPFNIYILPFYSFPTPPGGKWGGVAGVRRLFGRAFPSIEAQDTHRIQALLNSRLRNDDTVLVFQRDAYKVLSRLSGVQELYDYKSLLQQPIISAFNTDANACAKLVCMLPTRLLHSHQTKAALCRLAADQSL